jgi:hypothetical protein
MHLAAHLAALIAVMGNVHRFGDRRMPVPGILGIVAAAAASVLAAVADRLAASAAAGAAVALLLIWLLLSRAVDSSDSVGIAPAQRKARAFADGVGATLGRLVHLVELDEHGQPRFRAASLKPIAAGGETPIDRGDARVARRVGESRPASSRLRWPVASEGGVPVVNARLGRQDRDLASAPLALTATCGRLRSS